MIFTFQLGHKFEGMIYMDLFQLTQGTQGARKNSALYNSSNNSSYTETATDENGFSYKDLLEQFQDQRNLGKKNQQETSRKSNPSTPIKETSAADMLKNLSFMSGSFNVASNAVLGSSAEKNVELQKVLMGDFNDDGILDIDDVMAIQDHIIEKKKITDPNMIKRMDLNSDGEIDVFDLTKLTNTVIGREEKKYLENKNEPVKDNHNNGGASSSIEEIASLITEVPNTVANIKLRPTNAVQEAQVDKLADNQDVNTEKSKKSSIILPINDTTANNEKESHNEKVGTRYLGDLDGNGKITPTDVVRVAEYIRGMRKLTDDELEYADMNQDGVVDKEDETILGRIFVDLEPMRTKSENAIEQNFTTEKYNSIKEQLINKGEITTPELVKRADLNGDGKVDWDDLQKIGTTLNIGKEDVKRSNGDEKEIIEPLDEKNDNVVPLLNDDKMKADITGNGIVDSNDLYIIKHYILEGGKIGSGYIFDFVNGKVVLNEEMIKKMDINDDGKIDLVDFSLAVNYSKGKKFKERPGMSRDNPIYIIDEYASDNVDGEYVNDKYVTSVWNRYTGRVYYIGKDDHIGKVNSNYAQVIMSNNPHRIVVPSNTDVYGADGNKICHSSGYSEISLQRDSDGISVSVPSGEHITAYASNTFLESTGWGRIRAEGDNSKILLKNMNEYESSFHYVRDVSIGGRNSTVIVDDAKFDGTIAIYAPNSRIENNVGVPLNIRVDHNAKSLTVENIDGKPVIKSNDGTSWVELFGNVNADIKIICPISNGSNEKISLKDIPGYKEFFGTHNNVTIEQNPNNPNEWLKVYRNGVTHHPGETFTYGDGESVWVSVGNEVEIAEANGKITMVVPNLVVNGGQAKEWEGLIQVGAQNYADLRKGTANATRSYDGLSIEAITSIELDTFSAGKNITVNAKIGDNYVNLDSDHSSVHFGDGNDTVVINGANAYVDCGDGNNTIDIASKNAYIKGGSGKDIFNVKHTGNSIDSFSPDQDELHLLDMDFLGELVAVPAGRSIVIRNAAQNIDVVSLIGCDAIDKVRNMIDGHNKLVKVHQAMSDIDDLRNGLSEIIGGLYYEGIIDSQEQGKADSEKRIKNIVKTDKDVPQNIIDDFIQTVMEDMASKPGVTTDTFTNLNEFSTVMSSFSSKLEKKGKNYEIRINGYGIMDVNIYSADVEWKTKDLLGRETTQKATIALPSNPEEICAAMKNFSKIMNDIGNNALDDAIKTIASELTGINKKTVDMAYDIGRSVVELYAGNGSAEDTDTRNIFNAISKIGKPVIENAIRGFYERKEKSLQSSGKLSIFDFSWGERKAKNTIDALVKLTDVISAYNELSENGTMYSASDYGKVVGIIGETKKLIDDLA